MKKFLIGLSALAFVCTAQAEDPRLRLAKCIKAKIKVDNEVISLRSDLQFTNSTLQSTESQLRQCQLSNTGGNGNEGESRRLRRQLRKTERALLECQQANTGGGQFGETARLRRELKEANRRNEILVNENYNLQDRLLECESTNLPPQSNEFFCTAACKTYSGKADMSYLGAATAYMELEAQNKAVQNVRKIHSCSYGVVNVSCAQQTFENANYCVAGCKTYNGNVDNSYTLGAYGKSQLEAGFNAINEVKKTFSCSYGVKVSNCN
jgi:hypothetical protein